ncbi:MAG TPA: hypothetical protein VKB34_02760 [Povalibacter sp.]|nr:hypothetical protein [Povalibacter sp.]
MRKTAARLIAGTVIGSLFVVAVLLAWVADLLDSEIRKTGNGTTDQPPESLQRLSLQDRAT